MSQSGAMTPERRARLTRSFERSVRPAAHARIDLLDDLSVLEHDWSSAITAIAVPMLQGTAVHTAVVAEQMAETLPHEE